MKATGQRLVLHRWEMLQGTNCSPELSAVSLGEAGPKQTGRGSLP